MATGDTCQVISLLYGITLDQFYSYNQQLSRDYLNLLAKYSYCVDLVSKPPVSFNMSVALVEITPFVKVAAAANAVLGIATAGRHRTFVDMGIATLDVR